MQRIYRVEDESGKGPYTYSERDLDIPRGISKQHPAPYNERGLGWDNLPKQYNWYFGFKSLEQLYKWFSQEVWLERLTKVGMRVSVYEVPLGCHRKSERQAIFLKDVATKVEELSLI